MEIDIRRAAQEDLDAAEQLYNDVCSALEAGTNWPGWRQGVYPTRTDARRAQASGAPRRPGRCTSPGTVPAP